MYGVFSGSFRRWSLCFKAAKWTVSRIRWPSSLLSAILDVIPRSRAFRLVVPCGQCFPVVVLFGKSEAFPGSTKVEDDRAHCYCASLVRTLFIRNARATCHVIFKRAHQVENSAKYRADDLCVKVHLTPSTISAKMQTWNCSKSDLTFFRNIWNLFELQYNLKFDTLCLMTELVKGLGLFWIWRHKLFCMHVHKELMPCKWVCDVNSGIEPGHC